LLFGTTIQHHAIRHTTYTAQVDSPDSLENVETKWVGEIAENCPGVKLVLVALKCDLRKKEDDDADDQQPEKPCIDYNEGLRVAEKIKALRYLGKPRQFPK
jgi:Rho family protein